MTTKAQNILQNVHDTLEAIQGGSSFVTAVKAVYGHDKPYFEPQSSEDKDRPYINIGMPSDELTEEANAKVIKRMSLPVEGVVTYDPQDPKASRAAAQDLMGDIEKALAADHTRGTYAIDTTVTAGSQPSMIETKIKGKPGCITTDQTVAIDFGHSRTDPSSD